MQSAADLRSLLNRIDHRGYPAYKDTKGTYRFPGYVLSIDHVQGDPFASPSKVSIHVEGKAAAFPSDLYCGKDQRIALQDELTRQFAKKADQFAFQAKGSGKSGMIAVSRCGQEVLERTACRLDPNSGDIILRMEIGFPANGRTINARELEKILFQFVPECVKASLFYKNADAARLRKIIDLAEFCFFGLSSTGHTGEQISFRNSDFALLWQTEAFFRESPAFRLSRCAAQ